MVSQTAWRGIFQEYAVEEFRVIACPIADGFSSWSGNAEIRTRSLILSHAWNRRSLGGSDPNLNRVHPIHYRENCYFSVD